MWRRASRPSAVAHASAARPPSTNGARGEVVWITQPIAGVGARELYESPNTVKTQCNAIYRKLAVTNRQAAVQAAREHRLL